MVVAISPTWEELASADAPLRAQLARLSPERSAQVHGVLEAMARCEPTPAGITAAWKLVVDALPALESPAFAGSGEGPNRSALRTAAMRVLTGLVTRAAAGVTSKEALERLLGALDALEGMTPDARTSLKDEALLRAHARVKP